MKPMDLMDALGELPDDFIAQKLSYEPVPRKRTAFLVSKPFLAGVSTAACLMLIVGLGVGVWSRQQKIETRPPQETQTTTVIQTETRTETTAQVTTESQTTGKQTETNAMPTKSQMIESTSAIAGFSETSVISTTITPTSVLNETTELSQIKAIPKPASTPMHTTSQPAQYQTAIMPLVSRTVLTTNTTVCSESLPTSAANTHDQTAPAWEETTVTLNSSLAEDTTAETKPAWEESTAAASTCESTTASEPYLPGCSVTRIGTTNAFDISYPVTDSTPEDFSICYHMEGERFSIQFSGVSDNAAVRNYFIYDNQLDSTYVIQQTLIKDFRLRWTDNGTTDLMPTGMGISGFFTYEHQTKEYHLYWSDGKYAMTVMADHPLYRLNVYSDLPTLFKADDSM